MIKLITYNSKIDNFIIDSIKKLNKYKINLVISCTPYVKIIGKMKSNAYFDDVEKVLAIAIKKPIKQWLPIFVHEVCHFEQWLDNDPVWKEYSNYNPDPEAEDLMFSWIEKRPLKATEYQIKKDILLSKKLELNNEKRAYKKILDYNLPIDLKQYAKRAGAYVSFYDYVIATRKWYKIGKEPYNNKKILKLMPDTIQDNYDYLQPKLIKLFKECV